MNNIGQLRYAIEVERVGSISKAAENLYMGQPQLSKAIRELEEEMGIVIFNRTPRGVIPTPKGNEFIAHAKRIVEQADEFEALFKNSGSSRQIFNLSVPRANYAIDAFMRFVSEFSRESVISINYKETNATEAIRNVFETTNNIAVIRFQNKYRKYFINALAERDLKYIPIWTFSRLILLSSDDELADRDIIRISELSQYIELIHGDNLVPGLPAAEARRLSKENEERHTIAVYERASQLEMLMRMKKTYMCVSPLTKEMLAKCSFVQKKSDLPDNRYTDVLIYRNAYRFSETDSRFIEILRETTLQVKNDTPEADIELLI